MPQKVIYLDFGLLGKETECRVDYEKFGPDPAAGFRTRVIEINKVTATLDDFADGLDITNTLDEFAYLEVIEQLTE